MHTRLPDALLACFLCCLPGLAMAESGQPRPPHIAAGDPDFQAGFLNVMLYDGLDGLVVDEAGVKDSTAGIRRAIKDGIEYGLTVYVPPGTYRVSGTLAGEQPDTPGEPGGCCDWIWNNGFQYFKAPSLVGPSSGPRPTIRLSDHSPGFGDPSSPRAVIHFRNMNGSATDNNWQGSAACGFYFVVSNLDIDLGSDNPGAIGVQVPSAQWSYLENVKVNATGAYAGLRGDSNDNGVVNLEVVGGRYGVVMGNWGGHSYVGLRLRHQTEAALIDTVGSGAIQLTGFEIETSSGPVIRLTGGNVGSSLALLDGVIKSDGTEAAIDNASGRNVFLSNVYFKGSAPLVKSGSRAAIAASGEAAWDRVAEYSHTDTHSVTTCKGSSCATQTSHNMVDGVTGQDERVTVDRGSAAPPGDLRRRHVPGAIPWHKDAGVANVRALGAKGDGVTDDTAVIQQAIDSHDSVFIPRGDYVISKTLRLRANSRLFGVPGQRSRLRAPAWDPKGQFLPVIRTVDDAKASTYLGDLSVKLPSELDRTFLSALDWRAGRNSVVRQFSPEVGFGQTASHPRKLVHIRNNGGGRWYGLSLMLGSPTDAPGFRALMVEGTREPLTLYHANPEHTRADATNIELSHAENVRLLGSKTESCAYGDGATCSSFLWISNSSNVMVMANINNTVDGPDGAVKIVDSSGILLANITNYLHHWWSAGYTVRDVVNGGDAPSVPITSQCSLFRKGAFDPRPFSGCSCPDADSDQHQDRACGGDDCDDGDGRVCPTCQERCDNDIDDDCDGSVNEGCGECASGATRECAFAGPAGAPGVGACRVGTQSCADGVWSNCSGEVLPGDEKSAQQCTDDLDNDCDGLLDEHDPDCSSKPEPGTEPGSGCAGAGRGGASGWAMLAAAAAAGTRRLRGPLVPRTRGSVWREE